MVNGGAFALTLFPRDTLQWVLSDELYGFHYPISLTMMHMGFSGVVAVILVRIFKVSVGKLIWDSFRYATLPWNFVEDRRF
jgi:hypothetical protein